MEVIYLFLVVLFLIVNHIISLRFSEIAEMKGHADRSYYWYVFLLGVLGILMVIALPDIASRSKNAVSQDTHSATPVHNTTEKTAASFGMKVCPKCGQSQKADRNVCFMCGHHFVL